MTRISGLGIGEGRKEGARQTEGTGGAEAGRVGGCEQRVHMQPSMASAQRQDEWQGEGGEVGAKVGKMVDPCLGGGL